MQIKCPWLGNLSDLEGHIHCPAHSMVVTGSARAAGAAQQTKGLPKLHGIGVNIRRKALFHQGLLLCPLLHHILLVSPPQSKAVSPLPFPLPKIQLPTMAVPPGKTQAVSPGQGATSTHQPIFHCPLQLPRCRGRKSLASGRRNKQRPGMKARALTSFIH